MAKGLLWEYARKLMKGQAQFTGEIPKECRGNLSAVKALEAFKRIIFQLRRTINNKENGDVLAKMRLDSINKSLTKDKRSRMVKEDPREKIDINLVIA